MDIKELNVNMVQDGARNHPWEYARAKVVLHLLRKHLRGREALRVMDIGCGDTFFMEQFCRAYPACEAVAVDTAFDESLIEALSEKHRELPVCYSGSLDDVDLAGKRADVIFLMDVIEHIEDDGAFLADLLQRPFVDEHTILMMTVPAFNSLYSVHDKWLGHYRRYDQKMLRSLAGAQSLSVLDGGYFFTSLLLPRFLQKKMESGRRVTKPVTGVGGWTGGRLRSKLYEWALLADYHFFRIFRIIGVKVPGLSSYLICKQPS